MTLDLSCRVANQQANRAVTPPWKISSRRYSSPDTLFTNTSLVFQYNSLSVEVIFKLDEKFPEGTFGHHPPQQGKLQFTVALLLREEAAGGREGGTPQGEGRLRGASQRLHRDHLPAEQALQAQPPRRPQRPPQEAQQDGLAQLIR
jgi:hypothetical protein